MTPELSAILAAFLTAMTTVATTRAVRAEVDPWAMLLLLCVSGTIVVAVLIPPVGLVALSPLSWLLLFGNGILWVGGDFAAMRASRWIDPSVARFFAGVGQVLVCLAGVVLFAEIWSPKQSVGALLMVGALFTGVGRVALPRAGLSWQVTAVIATSVARVYDTYLARTLTPELITFTGYLTTSVIMAMVRPRQVLQIPSLLRAMGAWGVVAIICSPLGYYFLMQALAHGALSTTTLLLQTSMVFLLLGEWGFITGVAPSWRRLIAGVLCVGGALLLAR